LGPKYVLWADGPNLAHGKRRRPDISPFQIFYYSFSLLVFALAWLKGGHAERFGVTVLIIAWIVSFAPPLMIGRLHADHAVEDVLLMLVFGWLALKGDRWWPLVMTAAMALTVLVHVSMVLVPDLDRRADVAARLGLGVLTSLSLLLGVFERWLAGERPVSESVRWRRVERAS
jgi:hypothetical protein